MSVPVRLFELSVQAVPVVRLIGALQANASLSQQKPNYPKSFLYHNNFSSKSMMMRTFFAANLACTCATNPPAINNAWAVAENGAKVKVVRQYKADDWVNQYARIRHSALCLGLFRQIIASKPLLIALR